MLLSRKCRPHHRTFPLFCHLCTNEFLLYHSVRRPKRPARSLAEQHYIEDTIASIKLRINHKDVYEEWEKETKKEAFVSLSRL